MIRSACLLVLCIFSYAGAVSAENATWTCLSFDHLKRSYAATGTTKHQSMAAARKQCISQSALSSRCRVSRLWCEQGDTPTLGKQCAAEDEKGKRFQAKGDDACQLALKQCRTWQRRLAPTKRQHCAIVHG